MNRIKKGSCLTIRIESLSYPNNGTTIIDNKPIVVPNTLPGDEVTVLIIKKRARKFEGKILEFVKKSPLRKTNNCHHFPKCGGCQLMDIEYKDQTKLKFKALKELLSNRLPHLAEKLQPIIPSTSPFYYRNKMEFAFTQVNNTLHLGLKERGHFDKIVPIKECRIQSKEGNKILNSIVSELNKNPQLTVWDLKEHKGDLRHCVIRHSYTTGHTLINFIVSRSIKNELAKIVPLLVKAHPQISGILMSINPHLGDHTNFEEQELLYGIDTLSEKIGDLNYTIPNNSFFQTNTHQTHVLYNEIKKIAKLNKTDTLLDLYCGSGTIGLFCSDRVKHVVGVEENPASIKSAHVNSQQNNISNATFIEGRVKNILKFNALTPDTIIVDPPRAGMVPKALKRLIECDVPTITYVSCNPKTCWEDLNILEQANYKVESIQPIDMFPNTYHVETITHLRKHDS